MVAIEITFDNGITSDSRRIHFINGILNRKLLEGISPDRAAEERQIDILQSLWRAFG